MCVTQLASADAVQVHSGVVVSSTCCLPPEELMADGGLARVRPHLLMVDGAVEVTAVDPHAASHVVHAATIRN